MHQQATQALADLARFPLLKAIIGRRSRRFFKGATLPAGPFSYTSKHEPQPLSELEQTLVVTAVAGQTGWQYLIMHNEHYAPDLPNYAGSAGGRTFPTAAGFQTSDIFFTNDEGIFFLSTRDMPECNIPDPCNDLVGWLEYHRQRIRKLSDRRLVIPPQPPHMEGHNTWVANQPGTLLVCPVGDLAQHMVATLCYLLQNGFVIYDDINNQSIPGMERFKHLADINEPYPLTCIEQLALTEMSVELGTACYSGALLLQAMGLGGWTYNGIDRNTLLGAGGDPQVPGLGFRYDTDPRWPLPNPTGLPGVFEGYCPPHYPDMAAAVDAFCQRKFGPGGPFHRDTPGPYKETSSIRGQARMHDTEFKECVSIQAQYIYDRFGKFPGTVPTLFSLMYLQAQHIDLDFYDQFFQPGSYLDTHARHDETWHGPA